MHVNAEGYPNTNFVLKHSAQQTCTHASDNLTLRSVGPHRICFTGGRGGLACKCGRSQDTEPYLVFQSLPCSQLLLQAGALLSPHTGSCHDHLARVVGHDTHANGKGRHCSRRPLRGCYKPPPSSTLLPYPGHSSERLLRAVWLWHQLKIHNALQTRAASAQGLYGRNSARGGYF